MKNSRVSSRNSIFGLSITKYLYRNYELQKNDCKLIIEIGVNHNGNMNLQKND